MGVAGQSYNSFRLTYSSWMILLLIGFFSAGCLAGTRTLTADAHSRVRRVAVIPMESPPLAIAPGVPVTVPGADLVLAPEPFGTGTSVLASVFGLLILADLPRALRNAAAKADSVESLWKSETSWSPSVALAGYLVTRLEQSETREVTLVDTARGFPGLERMERTVLFPRQIRDWYNVDRSPIDYSGFAARGIDGILEVAVVSYGLSDQTTVVGDVLIKLSDPRTGVIIARTRQYNLHCGSVLHPFDNGAQELKATITVCLEALGEEALREIGLFTRANP